jgi:tetratricopeptide (TPR) repeat protein
MVAFLLTTGGVWKKQTLQVASSAVPQPAASPHPQMVVQVVRLAPPAGTESGLVFRGAIASDDPNSEELAMGFASYNKGDYHLAATYFAKAAKRFPSSDVPALYQGVSELLAGDNSAALESLTRADAIAKPDRKDAAAWYHAAAAARAHAPVALSLFQSLCGRDKSTYAQQACIVSASQPKSAQ